MIARVWRGWTAPQNADAYEHLLNETVLPGLRQLAGFHGAYILRQDEGAEIGFVVMTLFESIEVVKRFAGENYATPVFEPEALQLLSRYETVANHYEIRTSPS